MAKPNLYVEGSDDRWVVINLMKRHGVNLSEHSGPKLPFVECRCGSSATPSVEQFIKLIPSRIEVAENPVGFVIDADPGTGLAARWQSVRHRLTEAGVDCPGAIPSKGFIGASTATKVPVGVWLMPDNQRDGTIEHFLRDLIDTQDTLISHAEDSTNVAEAIDRRFAEAHQSKARLHAWLAWQGEPGCPYGTAINNHYFRDDSPAAIEFVAWFKELYQIV